MFKVGVIGTGYVGLVQGSCLSDFGLHVICTDIDREKVNNLNQGRIPIYEPGIEPIIQRNVYYKRLEFSSNIKRTVEDCDVIFIAVGTPSSEDGSADLQYVKSVARDIAQNMNGYKVIVTKSTVPVGTGRALQELVASELDKRGLDYDFDIVSNPEFLREGSAVHDFSHPDRVVIGTDSERAREIMRQVYHVLYLNNTPFVETNIETAEMIKYASNAFLAMKITFINEIANLCELVGANALEVAIGMGLDTRIGPKFLEPGPGYGGSCFPKDTRALARIGLDHGITMSLVEATVLANERQKVLQAEKIAAALGDLNNKQIAILGLSFKPNTDDMREAPSTTILSELARRGATLRVFDPVALTEAKRVFREMGINDSIIYCTDAYQAAEGSDALVIVTEWDLFRNLDLELIKADIKQPFFFDLRNIYRCSHMEAEGFKYFGVGQGNCA